jgi:hypothetical protein
VGRYSAAASKTVATTANAPQFQLRPTSTAERLYVVEVGVGVGGTVLAAAQTMYLARSTAVGTATTTLAGQPMEVADGAAIGTLDSVLSVAPTFSATNFLRLGGLPSAIGSLIVWTFYDKPLVIDRVTTTGLVVANVAAVATGVMTCYMTWDE